VQYGDNEHHKVEAAFKALALALRQAVSSDVKRRDIPSSKGVM
ncbi:MAG: imidazoleglycerol-phosphate dehydratase, partial [Nitrososphaerales archaeon]|nr:imidazoleglycerol-phosphate dehydratase [Nitrososphaerales archaeon]